MPLAERRSAQPAGSPARAGSFARRARQRGLRAANSGRPAAGARSVRAGLLRLGWAEDGIRPDARQVPEPHRALAARLLIVLASLEAEQGRTEYGLGLLDRAEGLADPADPADRGVLLSQRGLLYMRMWRGADALRMLSDGVAMLEGNAAETANLAIALLNRGFVHLNAGDVRRARVDLGRCQRIAAADGLELIVAKTVHDLGYCDLLAGDIPAALQRFNAAADSYRRSAPGNLPVLAMDKARALLAAGLADDAASELDSAIASFRRQRLDQDLAGAELTRSQAALAAGEPAAARRWAGAAERRFRRQGNDACACLAELTRLRAWSASSGRPARIAAQAPLLAVRLRGCGLRDDADLAELIAARALIVAGRPGEARQHIAAVRRRGPAVSLDVSLLRRLAGAELAKLDGQAGAALAELRAGLAMVHARRGRLGSLDLQTGAAALGADLAAAGLRLALDRGSAPLVFAWLERSRAQAFRVRPVRPPADQQAAAVLAELRQLSHLIRTAELAGDRDPAKITRRAELQREIREHSWQASGQGEAAAQAGQARQASLGEVAAVLDETGQSLASILARDGRMYAVILRQGSACLAGLGDFEAAAEAARRLNADLDSLAGRRLPARLEAVIRESIRHQAEVLTAEILAPLRSSLGDGASSSCRPGRWPASRGACSLTCAAARSRYARRHRPGWPRGAAASQRRRNRKRRRSWSRGRISRTRPPRSPR